MPTNIEMRSMTGMLIIFDFDGVIITGSNEGYFRCYHKALGTVGLKLTRAVERKRILQRWGTGYKYQLKLLLKERPQLLSKAIKTYEKYYYSPLFSRSIQLVKGADTVLRQLAKIYTLAIATGMIRETLNKLLKKFSLTDVFAKIVTSDEIVRPQDRKPSPFMLNKALNYFKIDKNHAVYVGDGKNDVLMAQNAGITPVVVLSGHLTKDEATRLEVKHIISDITYLPKVLSTIL